MNFQIRFKQLFRKFSPQNNRKKVTLKVHSETPNLRLWKGGFTTLKGGVFKSGTSDWNCDQNDSETPFRLDFHSHIFFLFFFSHGGAWPCHEWMPGPPGGFHPSGVWYQRHCCHREPADSFKCRCARHSLQGNSYIPIINVIPEWNWLLSVMNWIHFCAMVVNTEKKKGFMLNLKQYIICHYLL